MNNHRIVYHAMCYYEAMQGLRSIMEKPHDCYLGDGLCVKKSLLKVDTLMKPKALAFVRTVE